MNNLEKVKEDCAQYGKQRNELNEEIEREYSEYLKEVQQIYKSILETGVEKGKKKKFMGILILAASIIIGMIILILGGSTANTIAIIIGLAVVAIGIYTGVITINKAESIIIDYKGKANTLKNRVNKVVPNLI